MASSPTTRSAIANGSRLFIDNLDGRSALARRHRDLIGAFVSDLGGDGNLTEAQRQLVRRAAALAVWSEDQERKIVNGDSIDATPLVTASNALRRLLQELGLAKTAPRSAPRTRASGTIPGYLERT